MSAKRVATLSDRTLIPAGIVASLCVASSLGYAMFANIKLQVGQHDEILNKSTASILSTADKLSLIQTDLAVVKTKITTIENSLALRPTPNTALNECQQKANQEGLSNSGRALSMRELADCTFKEWGI